MGLSKADIKSLANIALRLAPPTRADQSPVVKDLLKTALTTLVSGSVGALITVIVFAYQANKQADTWRQQNNIEYRTKIINEKSEILRTLRRDVVRYANLDVQTGIEANMRNMRTAVGMAIPGANKEILKELSEIPSQEQMKEHREIWSSMLSTALLVRVYFGEKIAGDLSSALNVVGSYPNNLIDPFQLANLLKRETANGQIDLRALNDRIAPYIRPPGLPKGLFDNVFAQMVESIEQDVLARQSGAN